MHPLMSCFMSATYDHGVVEVGSPFDVLVLLSMKRVQGARWG